MLGAVGSMAVKGATAAAKVTAKAAAFGAKTAAAGAKGCVESVVEQTRQVNEAARLQRMEDEQREAERIARKNVELSGYDVVECEDVQREIASIDPMEQSSSVRDAEVGVNTHPVRRMSLD